MSDDLLARICVELVRDHGAHTILLYGSRADGSATLASDFDVAAFAPIAAVTRDTRVVDGQFLDLFVHPEAVLGAPAVESQLMWRGGQILAQRNDEATTFLAALDALHACGPAALPDDELQARRVWAWKMAARMERGDAEGDYRRNWLLTALLEDYFHLRGRWYEGPKKALAWLESQDLPTYLTFERALRPAATHAEIRQLIARVVGDA